VAEVSVSTWLVRRSALHRNPEGRRDELSTSDVRRGRSGILIAAPGAVPSQVSSLTLSHPLVSFLANDPLTMRPPSGVSPSAGL